MTKAMTEAEAGSERVWGLGFWVLGFRVWGLGFRVLDLGFWVLGFGFGVIPPLARPYELQSPVIVWVVLQQIDWVLEYYTLILFLVLGSYYRYLYLKSIYFFSRVYCKGG